jgi:hypothetical protein
MTRRRPRRCSAAARPSRCSRRATASWSACRARWRATGSSSPPSPGTSTPAVFHCTTGKDGTGWAAASTLLVLGVSTDDVFADYLLTNDQLLPTLQPLLDQFRSIGGDPELLMPVVGVQKEYLQTVLDEIHKRYQAHRPLTPRPADQADVQHRRCRGPLPSTRTPPDGRPGCPCAGAAGRSQRRGVLLRYEHRTPLLTIATARPALLVTLTSPST